MSNAGQIMMWAGTLSNIPAGWTHCDGSLLSTSSYSELYKIIGNSFGVNPPTGQFYLPDLRGRFVRGVDSNAGRDPDIGTRTDMQNNSIQSSSVGSIQSHAFQNHTHAYNVFPDGDGNIASGRYWACGTTQTSPVDSAKFSTSTETRPINAFLYYIICTKTLTTGM
ncbi:tail fiber protein (plasmid) [Pantoea sp. Eser]|nr:tail fiber protein [Pantoea sp. Eser]